MEYSCPVWSAPCMHLEPPKNFFKLLKIDMFLLLFWSLFCKWLQHKHVCYKWRTPTQKSLHLASCPYQKPPLNSLKTIYQNYLNKWFFTEMCFVKKQHTCPLHSTPWEILKLLKSYIPFKEFEGVFRWFLVWARCIGQGCSILRDHM